MLRMLLYFCCVWNADVIMKEIEQGPDYLLQPQKPPAAGAGAAAAAAAGAGVGVAGLTGSAAAPVRRPNTPMAADAAAPAVVAAGCACAASPVTRLYAFLKLSSFCFVSSASCLAIASEVLACTSSNSNASCWSSVGGGAGTGGGACVAGGGVES